MFDKWLEIQSLSLVFIGEFNPVIITPAWLALKGLIREEEAKNADVVVIHKDLAQFKLDWVSIEINRNRCEFRTLKSPYFDMVRDLASSVFNILSESPIRTFGLNHIYELKLPDLETYYKFGAQLVSLDIWESDLKEPRLMNLEIIEVNRKDELDGSFRVKISPTGTDIQFGVTVNINDHYDLSKSKNSIELLLKQWDLSFERSNQVVSKFVNNIEI